MAIFPVNTSPKTPAHLRIVLDRLRNQISAAASDDITELQNVVFITPTADSSFAIGDVVYASGMDTAELAIATGLSTSGAIGISVEVTASGIASKIQVSGIVENTGWSLTSGLVYYLSAITAGALVTTPDNTPGNTINPIGIAVSATKLRLLSVPPVLL